MGYDFAKQVPSMGSIAVIFLALLGLSALSGFTYGPVAALLSEMFPPHVRYSSLSIPYHLGTGYFGGFLPLIASRSEEHTSELQSLMRISYAVFCLKKKNQHKIFKTKICHKSIIHKSTITNNIN